MKSLQSQYASVFFETFERQLLAHNSELLRRVLFTLRTACKDINYEVLHSIISDKDTYQTASFVPTSPVGQGWKMVIHYLFSIREKLNKEHLKLIYPILQEWNDNSSSGETTQEATLLAIKYYELTTSTTRYAGIRDERRERLIRTVSKGVREVEDKIITILDEVIRSLINEEESIYTPLAIDIVANSIHHIQLIYLVPEKILNLLLWKKKKIYAEDTFRRGHSWYDEELSKNVGLNDGYQMRYYPPSAYQTPILFLLRAAPWKTMKFITSLSDYVVEHYAESAYANQLEEITLLVQGREVRQLTSEILWQAYRGSHHLPDAYTSTLMALERYLLDELGKSQPDQLSKVLYFLLLNSKSSAIASVVCSITLAFPSENFEIALISIGQGKNDLGVSLYRNSYRLINFMIRKGKR